MKYIISVKEVLNSLDLDQDRRFVLSILIRVQMVCKGYQPGLSAEDKKSPPGRKELSLPNCCFALVIGKPYCALILLYLIFYKFL